MNLIDHIGNKVTLWTKEGNAMERRTLITADEMGIVVEPYTDPDNGPLPDQDHEVFVPWNRVKYVDLIKPYELLCDICKNPLGDNGIEFTTDGARHTDCKPVKPPSPEFVEKAKTLFTNTYKQGTGSTLHNGPSPEFLSEVKAVSEGEPLTYELVDMLAKREGVKEVVINPHEYWRLTRDQGIDHTETGPARILVVTD